jgi:hypothetical protein
MRTIAVLINEWIEAKPNRSAAALARATGVPKSTISSIMAGRRPRLEVLIRLGLALPPNEVLAAIALSEPGFLNFLSSLNTNVSLLGKLK